MTKTPATLPQPGLIEAEARLWAKDYYARMKEVDPAFGKAWIDPAISHIFARRWIKATAQLHPLNMAGAVDLAVVHRELAAHEALIELIAERQERREDLGETLTAYDIRLKRFPFKAHSGPSRSVAFHSLVHVVLILELHNRFGLKLTRSQIGKKRVPSACSIAAEEAAAAGLGRGSEDAFRKLYDRYAPMIAPDGNWAVG